MGVLRSTSLMLFYTLVITLILMTVPGIPPHYKFEAYSVRPPRKLEGKLTPNDILDRAELVVEGKFVGPESIAVKGSDIYSGVEGGNIIKVDLQGKWKTVAKITVPNCLGTWKSPCARPLGMRFSKEGKLIVADATVGLVEVDVNSGTTKVILPVSTKLDDGQPLNFPDDLDIDSEGNIYFSDASQTCSLTNVYPEAFAEPTGRLIKFDPKTKKTEVLISGIHFANGVQLSRNEDFVVVSETLRMRMLKYYIKGPKKGVKESMIEGLPGIPDNVRSNGKGGFYISLVMPDSEQGPSLRMFLPLPSVKRLALRAQYALLKLCDIVGDYFSHPFLTSTYNYISHLGHFGDLTRIPKKVIIIDIEESGNIIGSLQTKNSQMAFISEIGLGEKYTYFGTPYTDKLWRIKTEYLV